MIGSVGFDIAAFQIIGGDSDSCRIEYPAQFLLAVAQILLAFAQSGFGVFALRNILNHGNAKTCMLDALADKGHREAAPQHAAVLADEPFFQLETGDLAAQQPIGLLLVLGDVVRMGKDRPVRAVKLPPSRSRAYRTMPDCIAA